MSGLIDGARVVWTPAKTDAIGTVTDAAPDRKGLIMVRWDGIGTFKEDPSYLSLAELPESGLTR